MKLFFTKILSYSFICFLILLALEFFVFPRNSNIMTIKKNLLQDKDTEVLILGNSHLFFGVNPRYLHKKSINVANKSRKLETDYYLLKNNIKNLKKVETVIVPISSYTLFTEKITESEKRLYYNYFSLNEYNQGLYNNSLIIHEPFRELVHDALFGTSKISKLGWRANEDEYKYDKKTTIERIGNIDDKLSRKLTIEKNINYLKEIINLCDDNQIKLFLILPPYHPDFYQFSKNRYDMAIKKILSTIDLKSAEIIDSKKFKITKDEYYENIDHLNKKGSVLFTKKIDSILP